VKSIRSGLQYMTRNVTELARLVAQKSSQISGMREL
jgi:hypothetical protein